MDRFYVSDTENKSRGDKEARVFLGSARKKLADISNFQPKLNRLDEDLKRRFSDEYIVKLQKENMALMQLLAERNKLIELSGIELQKHRLNLQKMQQQNLQLAQVNNQMLAELNESKERLMVLKHEVDCKNALVKANKFSEETEETQVEKVAEVGKCDLKPQQSRRKKLSRIPSNSGKEVQASEVQSKRRKLSGRILSNSVQAWEASNERRGDLFETDIGDDASHEDEGQEEKMSSFVRECGDAGRSSVGRPQRRAAEKVQSYKEIPLNVKMRRPR